MVEYVVFYTDPDDDLNTGWWIICEDAEGNQYDSFGAYETFSEAIELIEVGA